jgi:hypothetical protein
LLKILALGNRQIAQNQGETCRRSRATPASSEVGELMRVGVVLTEDAERILENIYGQISASDSRQNADDVLNRLLEMTEKRTSFPERGDLAKNFAP